MSAKKKNREHVLSAIKQADAFYEIKDNVYYLGPKAFVANSVVQWLVDKIESGELEKESVGFYVDAINKYIKDEVNLRWDEGNLVIEGK